MARHSIPVRALTGLMYAVGALAATVLACVVIILISDAIEIHNLMLSGG